MPITLNLIFREGNIWDILSGNAKITKNITVKSTYIYFSITVKVSDVCRYKDNLQFYWGYNSNLYSPHILYMCIRNVPEMYSILTLDNFFKSANEADTLSNPPNRLSIPSVKHMRKKSTAQTGAAGMFRIASEKAMNTNPGPTAAYKKICVWIVSELYNYCSDNRPFSKWTQS